MRLEDIRIGMLVKVRTDAAVESWAGAVVKVESMGLHTSGGTNQIGVRRLSNNDYGTGDPEYFELYSSCNRLDDFPLEEEEHDATTDGRTG